MIWISFGGWDRKYGRLFYWKRIYREDKWTPFCHVSRYLHGKRPATPVPWTLYGYTAVFDSIPSSSQVQKVIGLLKTFGLVPTGDARANNTTYELFVEPAPDAHTYCGFYGEPVTVAAPDKVAPGPDWKISVPDGHASTTSILYKGKPLFGATSITFRITGGERAYLELGVHPSHLEAILNDLEAEIKVKASD